MTITGQAKLAGVVGRPVGHSLSPALHGFWLEEYGIDGAYIPLAVAREDFSAVIHALRRASFTGVNITVPHKEAAFALATELSSNALSAGAANLLVFEGDRIVGDNTDVDGLSRSLVDALGAEWLKDRKVMVLGTGGAARSALLASDRLGAGTVYIVGRHQPRGVALKQSLLSHVTTNLEVLDWNSGKASMSDTCLLINATSAGMKGQGRLDITLDGLADGAAVCDLVYNPLPTELLRTAGLRGHKTIDGLGMLMYQAEPAFQAFYGLQPCVTPSLRARLETILHDAH
jgi:shikimate dehydrogenase